MRDKKTQQQTLRRITVGIALLLACWAGTCDAQQGVNVLFIGNSYTEVNNLPLMVQEVAASMGDQLIYQSNTPGGCTFSQHCNNQSMSLICNGGWDIVVLQEQSQYPSFPQAQVEAEVFPYAKRLVDSIYAHNPCCEPMFYMTWGRKNGDAGNAPFFPVLGTYEGMDSMLCERYTYMAQQYDAALCPVGRVWRYLRENHADIELYQADESHPSVAGTYAAACAFYTLFFHRDPNAITFSATLPEATASTIRAAAHTVVFEHLAQWQRPQPQAMLEIQSVSGPTASFLSTSCHADSLTWDFGDGTTVTTPAADSLVVHTYSGAGNYTVSLTASRHCITDSYLLPVSIVGDSTTSIPLNPAADGILVYPNPASGQVNIVLPSGMAQPTVTLCDLNGRIVAQQPPAPTDSHHIKLNLSGLPDGEYILRLSNATHNVIRKLAVSNTTR